MIIVEGPDGAGKSTLVKELQELFPDLLLGERGVEDRDKLWEVTRPDTYRAISEALTSERPHIWDRLFWSEFAYWRLTSRECQFTGRDERVIPDLIATIGAPVIWCMPPFDVVKQNVMQEHQMEGVIRHIESIYELYQGMSKNHVLMPRGLNVVGYDYTSIGANDQRQRIIGRIEAYLMERNPACVSSSMTTP
jgi:hypothetical protein